MNSRIHEATLSERLAFAIKREIVKRDNFVRATRPEQNDKINYISCRSNPRENTRIQVSYTHRSYIIEIEPMLNGTSPFILRTRSNHNSERFLTFMLILRPP